MIGRREFIAGLGSMAAWPVVARAQQPERVRRIGWLVNGEENDPEVQALAVALREGLAKLGWIEGRNLRNDYRITGVDTNRVNEAAAELVSLVPDAIVVTGTQSLRAVERQTQKIPVVATSVGDPVASGMVGTLARPDGNVTGFANFYPSIGGKWLQLLKEAAPHIARIAILSQPETGSGTTLASIEAAAPSLAVTTIRTIVRDGADIERAIDAFAAEPNGALLVLPDTIAINNREIIIRLAARHRLPAIYPYRFFAADGGLMVYSYDTAQQRLRAASYVDRILRGEKVSDLPFQFPTKYNLTINLKTAKALGLAVPQSILLRADGVIE
jgi:putative ABC transport system substrate-binding protein